MPTHDWANRMSIGASAFYADTLESDVSRGIAVMQAFRNNWESAIILLAVDQYQDGEWNFWLTHQGPDNKEDVPADDLVIAAQDPSSEVLASQPAAQFNDKGARLLSYRGTQNQLSLEISSSGVTNGATIMAAIIRAEPRRQL